MTLLDWLSEFSAPIGLPEHGLLPASGRDQRSRSWLFVEASRDITVRWRQQYFPTLERGVPDRASGRRDAGVLALASAEPDRGGDRGIDGCCIQPSIARVYLHRAPIDMRKQIDSLALLTNDAIRKDRTCPKIRVRGVS